jgi:carnitine O-acetyltransferase
MMIQLAYARLLRSTGVQREGGTYEAASTRKFFKGRTEAIRSVVPACLLGTSLIYGYRVVSKESDAWVASMDDGRASSAERLKLFAAASKTHLERAKLAGAGLGVDRHLFGLRQLVQDGEEVPALFDDALFKRSKNWVLSTSAVFSKHFEVYGWGEVRGQFILLRARWLRITWAGRARGLRGGVHDRFRRCAAAWSSAHSGLRF